MSIKTFTVDDSICVELASLTCIIENRSSYPVRLYFSDVQPNISAVDFHILLPGEKINHICKDENLKVYCRADRENRSSVISVTTTVETIGSDTTIPERLLRELKLLNMRFEEANNTQIHEKDINI